MCDLAAEQHWNNIKQNRRREKPKERIKCYKQTKRLGLRNRFFFGDQCSPSIIIETSHLSAFSLCLFFALIVFINFCCGSS